MHSAKCRMLDQNINAGIFSSIFILHFALCILHSQRFVRVKTGER